MSRLISVSSVTTRQNERTPSSACLPPIPNVQSDTSDPFCLESALSSPHICLLNEFRFISFCEAFTSTNTPLSYSHTSGFPVSSLVPYSNFEYTKSGLTLCDRTSFLKFLNLFLGLP